MRIINLNTNVEISEEDWTKAFGTEGRDAIETDVREWARNHLTAALAALGVDGVAR
jgi:hypothetical protein